jgi:Leucine-rich repeat (LRR) protein
MKTFIFSLLLLTMVFGLSNAQNVEIPDIAFLYALIDDGVDTNGDSLISYAEAEAVTNFYVDCKGDAPWSCTAGDIVSLAGIEAFINLDTLTCYHNRIASLDLSHNTALQQLNLFRNQLSSLDVSNCSSLVSLECSSNQLTSLDASTNTAIIILGMWK